MAETDFKSILTNADIPTTEEAMQEQWEQQLLTHDFTVNNDSPFSPFWRLQKALVGKPSAQLIDVLVNTIMPNTFVQTAHDQWLDIKGQGRNVERLPAVKAQGNIEFSRLETTSELVIPAQTVIESTTVNGVVYQLTTLADTTFNIGENSILVLAQAVDFGESYNLATGYYSKLLTPIEGVTVQNNNDWLVQNGQLIETDDNYRLRIRDKFATLGNFHVDGVYKAIISAFPGVQSDNIIFEHTAPRGPASANAYVFLETGQISQTIIDEINNHIAQGYHGHGDDLQVFAIPSQPQDITVEVWQQPNTEDIQESIENFIRCAFRENNGYEITKIMPKSVFSFSQLSSELHQQFPEIKTLNFTTNDINIGVWLPSINNLNVTNNV